MSVSATTTSVGYTGDGSVTSFAVTFAFQGTGSASELTVVERVIATGAETTKTYTTHYTVTGGSGSTGTVIAGTAPASTVEWHIRRNTTTTQTTDYVTNDPFAANTIEGDFDRLAMAGQERDGDISQSFKFPDTYTGGAATTFPEPVASAYLLFNAAGDALTTSTTSAAQYLGGNGTVLLPFYSFSADPNTGIYRIGADNIGIAVNGAKVVDIDASGLNAAIGQTSTAAGAFTTLTASGITTFTGTTTHGGDVISDADSTDSLGSTGVRWLKLWVDSIQTTANLDVAGNLVVTGNLTINGTTVTNDATNTEIKDPLIEINSGASSNANDLGLIFQRGSTGNNGFLGWDESGDYFVAATTTATGSSTGNISYSFAPFKCSAITATSGTLAGITSLGLSAGATITAGILDEDAMGSNSAVALATQQSIKAYSDNNALAPGFPMTWEADVDAGDKGNGRVWLNHATPASATLIYLDDFLNNGTTAFDTFVASLDDPTHANSAIITVHEGGQGGAFVAFKVSGAVVDLTTHQSVAITHIATVGSFTDGDTVGVTVAYSGDDAGLPAGIGDLSDVTLTGTAAGDILTYSGSAWIDSQPTVGLGLVLALG